MNKGIKNLLDSLDGAGDVGLRQAADLDGHSASEATLMVIQMPSPPDARSTDVL